MSDDVRLTQQALKVLRFLMETPREGRSGAEVTKETKVGSGTLYPMLARLEAAGWLKSEWETSDPSETGRPRKRFYRLTAVGQNNAYAALSELQMVAGTGEFAWTR
jgi:PadR family transcriptional regulator, regulatory protein PadR